MSESIDLSKRTPPPVRGTVTVSVENAMKAFDTIENVISQAQAGVTEFSHNGIVTQILTDLGIEWERQ